MRTGLGVVSFAVVGLVVSLVVGFVVSLVVSLVVNLVVSLVVCLVDTDLGVDAEAPMIGAVLPVAVCGVEFGTLGLELLAPELTPWTVEVTDGDGLLLLLLVVVELDVAVV